MAVSLRFAGNVRRVDAAVDVADGRRGIINDSDDNNIMSSADGFALACVGGTHVGDRLNDDGVPLRRIYADR